MKNLFQLGIGGNPAGRPRAQPDPFCLVHARITQLLPEVIERSLAQVRSGNVAALADQVQLMTSLKDSNASNGGWK
jgi:hypothetical protein